jgi:hypothetical protein
MIPDNQTKWHLLLGAGASVYYRPLLVLLVAYQLGEWVLGMEPFSDTAEDLSEIVVGYVVAAMLR